MLLALFPGTRANGILHLKNGVDYVNPGEEDQMEIYGWAIRTLCRVIKSEIFFIPPNSFNLLIHYQLQTESRMDYYCLVPDYHHRRPFEAGFSLGTASDAPDHSFQMLSGGSGNCFVDWKISREAHELLREEIENLDRSGRYVSKILRIY